MSYELDYSPPHNLCKWKWGAKSLKYSPWVCNLSDQMTPEGSDFFPASVKLSVDLVEGQYVWRVKTVDWVYRSHEEVGTAPTAGEAISCAETLGETAFLFLSPPWVRTALEKGWRPPLPPSKV